MDAEEFKDATWRKPLRSSGGSNNCVEVAFAVEAVGIRDSKDPEGGIIRVPRGSWSGLLTSVGE